MQHQLSQHFISGGTAQRHSATTPRVHFGIPGGATGGQATSTSLAAATDGPQWVQPPEPEPPWAQVNKEGAQVPKIYFKCKQPGHLRHDCPNCAYHAVDNTDDPGSLVMLGRHDHVCKAIATEVRHTMKIATGVHAVLLFKMYHYGTSNKHE